MDISSDHVPVEGFLVHRSPGKATPEQNRPVLKIFDQSFDCRDFAVTKTVGEPVTRGADDLEAFKNLPAVKKMDVQNRASGDLARQLLVALVLIALD